MMQSESIAELAAALAKAQGEMEGAAKNKVNPAFRSNYADLASAREACRGPLSANGLAIVQTTEIVEAEVVLVTTLMHTSGQWMRGAYPIRPLKPDPQSFGSALSYARRYALMAMVGLAAEDDDGHAASQGHQRAQEGRREAAAGEEAEQPGGDDQRDQLAAWRAWRDPILAHINEAFLSECESVGITPKAREVCNTYQLNNHLVKWARSKGMNVPEESSATASARIAAKLFAKRRRAVEEEVRSYLNGLAEAAFEKCGLLQPAAAGGDDTWPAGRE